tara:strand:- start:920 stop:1663 length:744 start_codon:yes stop_codon:yes gene_type:complete
MAKQSGLGHNFFIDGYDLSGDVSAVDTWSTPVESVDVTSISKSAMERIQGRVDFDGGFTTFFNDASLAQHVALSGGVTTDRNVSWTFGSTVGDVACGVVAKQGDYAMTRAEDGSFTASIPIMGNGVIAEWGNLLSAGKITHSSATTVASKDDSSSSSSGLSAFIQSASLSSGTATVKIQHSANDASWSDLITFTNVASASDSGRTSERKTVSGTVNRYLRIVTTGTFSTLVFVVHYRRGTSTDRVSY